MTRLGGKDQHPGFQRWTWASPLNGRKYFRVWARPVAGVALKACKAHRLGICYTSSGALERRILGLRYRRGWDTFNSKPSGEEFELWVLGCIGLQVEV